MTDRPECAVAECYVPRQHETACSDDRCTGCVPGLAMDGLLICQHHRREIERKLEQIPKVYAELAAHLAPYRSPQAPKGDGGRTTETPDVVHAQVFEIRKLIAGHFYAWCIYLRAQHGLWPTMGSVETMGTFLLTHVETLCKDRLLAPTLAGWLEELLYGKGRTDPYRPPGAVRLRNQARSAGLYLGACPLTESTTTLTIDDDGRAHRKTEVSEPCGGAIRYDREEARASREFGVAYQVTCPRCGTSNSWLWWQREIVGDIKPPALLTAVPLAMLLADSLAPELAAAGRKITPSTIGKWKWEGDIQPTACDLRSKRDLFDRTAVEAFARNRLKLNPESRTA